MKENLFTNGLVIKEEGEEIIKVTHKVTVTVWSCQNTHFVDILYEGSCFSFGWV